MNEAAPREVQDVSVPDVWGSRANVHTLAMLAVTLIALYLCLRMTQPFVSALAWALALAVLAMPLQLRLESKLRSVNLATLLSVLGAAVVVVVPVILVTMSMIGEAVSGVTALQAQLESGEWRKFLDNYPRLAWLVNWIDKEVDLAGTVTTASGALTEFATNIVKGSVRQLIQLLLTFYLLFFFLRDRKQALRSITYLSPLSTAQMNRLYCHVGDTLHATMYGTFVIALIQGTLGGLMFWALGLPAPLLWGIVMGLLAIVPVLGAFLIWIPAALFLLLSGHPIQALLLTVWGAVVIGGIDNLLYPMLVGNRLRMHTALVLISIVGGIYVFGAAGLILGPVVLTATTVLLEVWRHPDATAASTSSEAKDRSSSVKGASKEGPPAPA